MDKLKMHSVKKVDENVERIAQLFPNCVTEAIVDDKLAKVVDFDMLKQELSSFVVEGNEERYQFTWPDKKKSVLLANELGYLSRSIHQIVKRANITNSIYKEDLENIQDYYKEVERIIRTELINEIRSY